MVLATTILVQRLDVELYVYYPSVPSRQVTREIYFQPNTIYYKQSNFGLHLQTQNHEQNSKILLAFINRVMYMVDGVRAFKCACTLGKNKQADQ
jgi:hypothetical protein